MKCKLTVLNYNGYSLTQFSLHSLTLSEFALIHAELVISIIHHMASIYSLRLKSSFIPYLPKSPYSTP